MEPDPIISVVRKAGEKVMSIYKDSIDVEYKKDNSPVTKADMEAENILKEGLSHYGYGFICEETPKDKLDHDYIWVIDPIDGTRDFVDKTGEFAIMVGLLYKHKPVMGIVYAPALDKLYFARKGKGAFLNNQEIKVSDIKNIKDFRVVRSKFHFKQEDQDFIERSGFKSVQKVGSAGVKIGLIAEGKAELYFNRHDFMGKWDCCGPQVIIEEAGGSVFDIYGKPLSYESAKRRMPYGLIATNNTNKNLILKNL